MTDTPNRDATTDIRHARVLADHLDPNNSGDLDTLVSPTTTTPPNGFSQSPDRSNDTSTEPAESSLRLQGGDIHRQLYRIDARAKQAHLHQRSATFSHVPQVTRTQTSSGTPIVPVAEQLAPGGFRRQFLEQKSRRYSYMNAPVTKNFVAFLELYGNFAGEDLEESDDEDESDTEGLSHGIEGGTQEDGERRPLLGDRGRRMSKVRPQGDASNVQSFFTLLKAFVGTGIMFLPKAFKNGGMLFSAITLIVVSLVTCFCFHLLLACRARYGGGYGDFGETIAGPRMRKLVLASITISQLGFVCAGIIFVAENLSSFLEAVTPDRAGTISPILLITIQILSLIPFSFIRNISKLGPAALIADVCILIGLVYIYYYDIHTLSTVLHGFNPTIRLFNPRDFTLTIGSAIFTFEGIGLILPIQSSMRHPQHFNFLLYTVMLLITVIFTSVGVLCYGTFGDRTNTEIITNFPQTSKLVNAIQFLYAFAVLIGAPVQLFPAIRIIESQLFGHRSGKQSTATKWKKNALRTSLVLLVGVISAIGASDLDKFVALIGSFACVPLVYIYPAFLHWRGVARTTWERAADLGMMGVGGLACVYTTAVTVARWAES